MFPAVPFAHLKRIEDPIMRVKIGIIGTGGVGMSTALSLLHFGAVGELILHDSKPEVAEGEAMDLIQGSAFYPTARVRAGTIEEMRDCDAVAVTAGAGRAPGQSRLQLLATNAGIVTGIGRQLRGGRGIVVMVTNPVDVMTLVMTQATGLPSSRVIGTGTMLDSARLRQVLGRELDLDPRSIHGQVVGEHGASEVVLWSGVRVGGLPLRDWPGWEAAREARVTEEVRGAGIEVIRRKGATTHAIGLVTATLLKWMLRGSRRVLTVARVQEGALGLTGVALSLPTVLSPAGAEQVLEPEMTDAERADLLRSAEVLREAAGSLDLPG
jgi:L-lactate dehydrogenase